MQIKKTSLAGKDNKASKCKAITLYGTRCLNNAAIKGLCIIHYLKKNRNKKAKNGQGNQNKI